MAEGNSYVNQLLHKKADMNHLQKRLDTEVKPLEANLTTTGKAWAEVEKLGMRSSPQRALWKGSG